MRKIVHDLVTQQVTVVEMSAAEIADIQAVQAAMAARELLPKPGSDLLAQAEDATTIAGLRAVVVEMITRVYGLQEQTPPPAPPRIQGGEQAPETDLSPLSPPAAQGEE